MSTIQIALLALAVTVPSGMLPAWPIVPVAAEAPRDTAGLDAQPMSLETASGTIHGTLVVPEGHAPPYPVALLIAGSGPTDRDGNTGPMFRSSSLRLLAEQLASRGIATLRYDKRGIGQSRAAGGHEADLRFDTLVSDAARWVARLRGDPRFSSVTVIGHSEGALIGTLAARTAGADALVSLAGTSLRASDALRAQLRPQLASPLLEESEQVLSTLEAGRTSEVSPLMATYFRPSVQPYLISWIRYDPRAELAKLTTPILVVQGSADLQVLPASGPALAEANPRAQLLQIEGMNHVLKFVSPQDIGQASAYTDPSHPLPAALVDAVSRFIGELPCAASPRR